MTGLDRTLAIVALISLALYLAILVWFVREPALIVVCVLTLLLAGFDFARDTFGLRWRARRGSR